MSATVTSVVIPSTIYIEECRRDLLERGKLSEREFHLRLMESEDPLCKNCICNK